MLQELLSKIHLHPSVVHYPIALFSIALLLEFLALIFKKESWHNAALVIYVVAALLTPLVVWTGWEEAEENNLFQHPVLKLHLNFAFLTMWISLASLPILWVFKNKIHKYFRLVFVVFLILTSISVLSASYNGGRLVYEYGVDVEK